MPIMLRLVFFVKVFMTISFVLVKSHNQYMNPEWEDPHDWSADRDPVHKMCPQNSPCKPCEITVKTEYMRLVNSLFDPNEFRFDKSTNYLYRSVHIHITKEQMELLRKSKDPIYIDGLISEILSQTQFGTVQLVKEYTVDVATTIWRHLPSLPSLPTMTSFSDINFNALPRSRPIFINFVILVLTYFLCRRFRVNYFIVVFFAVFYFLYEYLDNECHRRIELNEAVEFIYGKEKNPCMSRTKMNWYDWLIGKDSRSECRDFLARQSQHKTQCGIVDLFHEFVSNIVMKQLKIFFTTIAEMVGSIGKTYGILITVVTIYFMKDLLVTIIQSVFKYIINPTIWSRVVADVASSSSTEGNSERDQNIPLVGGHDLRDINVGKALDLANQHIQLILETRKNEMSPIQPSGVEILAVTGTVSSVSTASATSSLSLSPSLSTTTSTAPDFSALSRGAAKNHKNDATKMPTEEQQNNHMEDDSSNESYEEIGDELVMSQNLSVVSISDTQPSEISSTTTTSTTTTASTEYVSSLKSSDTSSTSFTSDSTKPSSDSVEILSISSDGTS